MREVLLLKRGLYWRPDRAGYTGLLSEAGRYPEGSSEGYSDGVTEIPVEGAPWFAPSCCREVRNRFFMETAIKALRDGAHALTVSDAVVDVVWMPTTCPETLHDHLLAAATSSTESRPTRTHRSTSHSRLDLSTRTTHRGSRLGERDEQDGEGREMCGQGVSTMSWGGVEVDQRGTDQIQEVFDVQGPHGSTRLPGHLEETSGERPGPVKVIMGARRSGKSILRDFAVLDTLGRDAMADLLLDEGGRAVRDAVRTRLAGDAREMAACARRVETLAKDVVRNRARCDTERRLLRWASENVFMPTAQTDEVQRLCRVMMIRGHLRTVPTRTGWFTLSAKGREALRADDKERLT